VYGFDTERFFWYIVNVFTTKEKNDEAKENDNGRRVHPHHGALCGICCVLPNRAAHRARLLILRHAVAKFDNVTRGH